ncbi:hypothetical protein C5B90_13105 [Haloferax sp. Atlit-12N]|uniref:hypothetical protein n=1 Tax=Haloferax sp. Atlit-12N TaxID=2077203 RepID=UPI000E27BC79|nr:hypothetical protein [Haloferax sp. Atlit-12N]RDZ64034.1 hypothetical protein C5B90_13105 [Haloferax sp. Atlit-12N]
MRDEVEGKDDANHLYEWAVKVLDEELSRILADKKEAWREWKDTVATTDIPYEETKEYRRIVSKATTLNATQAAKSERMMLLKYFTSRAESPELKHTRLWKWLIEYVSPSEDDYVTQYLSGDMGAGKTDFAIFEAELWKLSHPDGVILSNITSLRQATTVENMDELDEWIENNPDTEFFFVFDEANKHASGTGDSSAVEDQLFPMVTFIRKNDGNMVIIGHGTKDIHKWVRELCDFVYKDSKKVAKFYKTIGSDGEPEGQFKTLRNIPPTKYDFDTNEVTDWSWSEDSAIKCIGENKEGDRCGTMIHIPYGEEPEYFCDRHKGQNSPHPDVPAAELEDTPFESTESERSESSDDAPSEPVLSDSSESDVEDDADETAEEVRDSADVEENPTSNDSAGDEYTVGNIPPDGWAKIFDKSGLHKDHIDSWEMVEEILNDRELSDLKRMME